MLDLIPVRGLLRTSALPDSKGKRVLSNVQRCSCSRAATSKQIGKEDVRPTIVGAAVGGSRRDDHGQFSPKKKREKAQREYEKGGRSR